MDVFAASLMFQKVKEKKDKAVSASISREPSQHASRYLLMGKGSFHKCLRGQPSKQRRPFLTKTTQAAIGSATIGSATCGPSPNHIFQ